MGGHGRDVRKRRNYLKQMALHGIVKMCNNLHRAEAAAGIFVSWDMPYF
ncbi:hypothetical protein IMSAGC012_02509 [Lachnospiraceae bacterium]|nr:hypothetical protein IMSAGC012_02509 [Lachnospiraceae bacterium]